MKFSQDRLLTLITEAEQLSAQIPHLDRDSASQKEAIYRWAVVGDEVRRLLMQAEEQLSVGEMGLLYPLVNKGGKNLYTKYREGEWRIPRLGGPGPGDDPPPLTSLRDLLQ
jgi:hypothetical protein